MSAAVAVAQARPEAVAAAPHTFANLSGGLRQRLANAMRAAREAAFILHAGLLDSAAVGFRVYSMRELQGRFETLETLPLDDA